MHAISTTSPLTFLPIDECEEWIWDIKILQEIVALNILRTKIKLVFNTNDFHADTQALYKIRKITGMRLIQMSTHNGNSQLWFYRSRHPSIQQRD